MSYDEAGKLCLVDGQHEGFQVAVAGKPFVKTAPAAGAIAMPAIGDFRPQQQAVEPDPRLALATIAQSAEPGSVELAREADEAKTAIDAQCIADTLAEEAYNRRWEMSASRSSRIVSSVPWICLKHMIAV